MSSSTSFPDAMLARSVAFETSRDEGAARRQRSWVDDARMPLPDALEYGAHWWVDADDGRHMVAFRADGYAGQVIVVVPSLDLVVVALANVQDGRSDLGANALVEAFAVGAPSI